MQRKMESKQILTFKYFFITKNLPLNTFSGCGISDVKMGYISKQSLQEYTCFKPADLSKKRFREGLSANPKWQKWVFGAWVPMRASEQYWRDLEQDGGP